MSYTNTKMKEEIGRLIDRLKALNEEQTKVTEKLKQNIAGSIKFFIPTL